MFYQEAKTSNLTPNSNWATKFATMAFAKDAYLDEQPGGQEGNQPASATIMTTSSKEFSNPGLHRPGNDKKAD